jgi:predicted RNA binding protein YcfA (HicA-like mRNA interferase family)
VEPGQRREGPGRAEDAAKGRLDFAESRGSHRQFVHPAKSGKVTVAGHESDEMPPKTLKSIMKQAEIP